MRLTSNQAAAVRKQAAMKKELSNHHFVEACKMYQRELDLEAQATQKGQKYAKKSARQICDVINKATDLNISERTVRDFVMKDRVGEIIKKGRTGEIPLRSYKALLGAFESFLKLAHQQGHKKLTKKVLQRQLNVCINKHPSEGAREGRKLLLRVEKDLAATLDIAKPNKVENRRAKWTTHYNVDIWYDSLKEFFVEYGFARPAGNDREGELEWVDDKQGCRIISIDETGIVLDNGPKNSSKGGRPAMSFYDPKQSCEATQSTHKSSYHCTGLFGATAGGEFLPPHFQLPTDAEDPGNHQIPIEFVEHMLEINGKFGFSESKPHPVTIGVNEKGGMNNAEFAKYMQNCLTALFPDARDEPGKRVCVLVDGGPGRTNMEMLAELRLDGILLFPAGPPNTTHLLQIMDLLFGLFKTVFFTNLEVLWQERLSDPKVKDTITRNDIGLLCFGGKAGSRDLSPELENAIEIAFAQEKITNCWSKKLGVYPIFNRAALQSKTLRHELIVDAEGQADNETDPMAAYLVDLERMNLLCCDLLNVAGYDGEQFRIKIIRIDSEMRNRQLTRPNTRERQDAFANAKTQGGLFSTTGGATMNGNDSLISGARSLLYADIKKLQKLKKERQDLEVRQTKAFEIIESEKSEARYISNELQVLISWKLGKACPSDVKLKPDRLVLWNSLKHQPAPTFEPWTDKDEEELTALTEKSDSIGIDDTNLGRLAKERKARLISMVGTLDEEQFDLLKEQIAARENE
jgi:hypothetical protein